jgi:autophagy-related protein 5
MLSRHSYLHVGLQEAVLRLHKFAPPTFAFTRRVVEEPDPASDSDNKEDESDDRKEKGSKEKEMPKETKEIEPTYPVCWFEDETTELPLRWQYFAGVLWDSLQLTTSFGLPWKIRLHFTGYPSSELLELDPTSGILTTIERTFKNALKQALVLEHGHAKIALNMNKQAHRRMWDSISKSKYSIYKAVKGDIQTAENPVVIPVRLLVGSSKPPIQKRCSDLALNLGQLLVNLIPEYFQKSDEENEKIQPKLPLISWRVSGIKPDLDLSILDLWRTLCQPDNFLYILILTQ